jgi:phosphonatase-like hydrolase
MKIELVVFDIAGTTLKDEGNVNKAFSAALQKSGYPVPVAAVNHVMGYRKIEAISILLHEFYPATAGDSKLVNTIHDNFISSMQAFYRATTLSPLPFAEELFSLLHGQKIKIALDTGFSKDITDIIIGRLGWKDGGLVDCVVSSDEVPEGRPQAHMIRRIMQELSISGPGNVVKVGDTEVDIAEGRNAKCGLVVSVTTGSYTRSELEGFYPDHIIDSLQELPQILNLPA